MSRRCHLSVGLTVEVDLKIDECNVIMGGKLRSSFRIYISRRYHSLTFGFGQFYRLSKARFASE